MFQIMEADFKNSGAPQIKDNRIDTCFDCSLGLAVECKNRLIDLVDVIIFAYPIAPQHLEKLCLNNLLGSVVIKYSAV